MRHYFPFISAPYQRWGRRARLLFLLFLMIAFFYFWQTPRMDEFAGRSSAGGEVKNKQDSPAERIGEQIVYDVYLGKIRLGYAQYHHVKKTRYKGQLVYLITFETQALRFHDRESIYCDVKSFLPLMIERKVSQFIKPEKITEVYDQENFTLNITKRRL